MTKFQNEISRSIIELKVDHSTGVPYLRVEPVLVLRHVVYRLEGAGEGGVDVEEVAEAQRALAENELEKRLRERQWQVAPVDDGLGGG